MIVLGIDPGINGGLAVMAHGVLWGAQPLPTVGDGTSRMVSGQILIDILDEHGPDLAVIERVGAMPGQGVSSMFRFGRSVGIVEGVLAAMRVRIQWVAPTVWKRGLGLPADKEAARQRALETFPECAGCFRRKADHGPAEAALLALWGHRASIASGEAA